MVIFNTSTCPFILKRQIWILWSPEHPTPPNSGRTHTLSQQVAEWCKVYILTHSDLQFRLPALLILHLFWRMIKYNLFLTLRPAVGYRHIAVLRLHKVVILHNEKKTSEKYTIIKQHRDQLKVVKVFLQTSAIHSLLVFELSYLLLWAHLKGRYQSCHLDEVEANNRLFPLKILQLTNKKHV